jgi:hypothetical protein
MMMAESKGKVLRDYRQFWMGHKGDIEARYTTNKGKLPDDVIQDMREAYARSQEFLGTDKTVTSEGKFRHSFRYEFLITIGYSEEELEEVDLEGMDNDSYKDMVRKRMNGQMINNGATQKVVNKSEVKNHLEKGWEYVSELSPDEAIIKLPQSDY